jgi:hypothetical protein
MKTSHHDVFISYAQQDKPVADAVCVRLETHRIRCWMAPRDVPPGKDFPEAIIEGIEGGRIVVVIFSSYANNSPHVIRELTNAVNKGRIIIPFRIEDVAPTKSMEYLISVPHWLDAVTPPLEKHIDILIHTIECILGTGMAPAACLAEAASQKDSSESGVTVTEPGTACCLSCHAPLAAGVKFCETCGAPVSCDSTRDAKGFDSLPEVEPEGSPHPSNPPADHVKPQPGIHPKTPIVSIKTIVLAGAVILLIILAAMAAQSGWFSSAEEIPTLVVFNTTRTIPEGMSEADYYRGTEAHVNTVTLTPLPTQTLAKGTELYLDARKDMSNVVVTVQFNGGPGTGLVQDSRVILTRSDGTVTEGKLSFNQRLSTVQLQGSRGTDRLQVIVVLYSGEERSIIDTLLPYRQYH